MQLSLARILAGWALCPKIEKCRHLRRPKSGYCLSHILPDPTPEKESPLATSYRDADNIDHALEIPSEQILCPRENPRHIGAFADVGDDCLAAHRRSCLTRFPLVDIRTE
jgi:hypothetical protein